MPSAAIASRMRSASAKSRSAPRGGSGGDQRLDFSVAHAAFLLRAAEPCLGVGLQQAEQGAGAAQCGTGPRLRRLVAVSLG